VQAFSYKLVIAQTHSAYPFNAYLKWIKIEIAQSLL